MSVRLQVIGDLVTTSKVIDVGCDHGLLGIYLASRGIYSVGLDINEYSIKNAIDNAKKSGYDDYCSFRVNNGLDGYTINDETVVIAGLGSRTILNIIGDRKIDNLIIDSHNDLYILRKELNNRGYIIDNEIIVLENGIYYCIIKFSLGKIKYSDEEYKYGPIILKNRKENREYFEYLKNKLCEILDNIPESYVEKRKELIKEIEFLN